MAAVASSNVVVPNATKEYAVEMDKADPLKQFRSRFVIPNAPQSASREKAIFFQPMAVGIPPKDTRKNVDRAIQRWGDTFAPDPDVDSECNQLLVPLLGAKNEKEVAVMNGTSVNGQLLMISFYRPTFGRYKVLVDGNQFCTEHHIIRSQLKLHGIDKMDDVVIDANEGNDSLLLSNERIVELMHKHNTSISVVWFECAHHLTGQVLDIGAICSVAAKYGIKVALDVAQGVGNVPLKLHEWGVDFAIFATYKYLSGGLGGAGGIFVHEKHHHDADLLRLTGDLTATSP